MKVWIKPEEPVIPAVSFAPRWAVTNNGGEIRGLFSDKLYAQGFIDAHKNSGLKLREVEKHA